MFSSFAPVTRFPVADAAPTAFRKFASQVQAILQWDEVVLISTMPRGGLQICRKLHLNEGLIRRYHASLYRQDVLVWSALRKGHAVPAMEEHRADNPTSDTPLAFGYRTVLAVSVPDAVFAGYNGVILGMRRLSAPQSALPDAVSSAATVRELFDRLPGRRLFTAHPFRQFIYDENLRCVVASADTLDAKIQDQLLTIARQTFQQTPDDLNAATRQYIRDAHGQMMAVSGIVDESIPALGTGRFVTLSITPDMNDWSSLTDETFEADHELTRLARSIAYMTRYFLERPTLSDIARSVRLSPFHYHRRFTESFGLTPKAMLFDLQIDFAKRLLADRSKLLNVIARECGFSHQSHFTSRFKQMAGVTPTQWRRLLPANV